MRPIAIVTGASTGIGFQTARLLARKGYLVVVATRSELTGAAAAARINRELAARPPAFLDGEGASGEAAFMRLDTASLGSVRAFADAFLARHGGALHALVLNAGAGARAPGEARLTAEGFEALFATNFLGHFMLTQLLLDALKLTAARAAPGGGGAPARVVTLGSVTHRLVRAAPAWPAVLTGAAPRGSSYYALSKLAAVAFAAELQRRLAGTGVAAVAVNPGAVNSDIWRFVSPRTGCWLRPLMRAAFLTPEQGAATSVAAATAAAVPAAGAPAGAPLLPVAAPAPLYLSPYAAPAWAQRAGGTLALLFDLIGAPAPPAAQAPAPLGVDERVGGALWDACESAVTRWAGL